MTETEKVPEGVQGASYYSRVGSTEARETQTGVDSNVGNQTKPFVFKSTAGRFQETNGPSALKEAAKFVMKVVTTPPAVALLVGGGAVFLGGVGLFLGIPLGIGAGIGAAIGKGLGHGETGAKIGAGIAGGAASVVFFPIVGLGVLGGIAVLGGAIHLYTNVAGKMDFGALVDKKLGKGPAQMQDKYIKKTVENNFGISSNDLQKKVEKKFRGIEEMPTLDYKAELSEVRKEIINEKIDKGKLIFEEGKEGFFTNAEKQYNEGIKLCEEWKRLDPKNPKPYIQLAKCHFATSNALLSPSLEKLNQSFNELHEASKYATDDKDIQEIQDLLQKLDEKGKSANSSSSLSPELSP